MLILLYLYDSSTIEYILPRGLNFWEGVKKVETFEISTKDGMEKNNEKEP